jgi:hypothetical protein
MLIFLDMARPNDYRQMYDKARLELNDLLTQQQRLQKRIVGVRKFLQSLANLCETEGVDVSDSASAEAADLLSNSTLADEVRVILKLAAPDYMRPHQIKDEIKKLGHDLTEYRNPQATIHMVLKRMVKSGEAREAKADGKKAYCAVPDVPSLSDPENPIYKSGMRPFPPKWSRRLKGRFAYFR